MDIGELFTENQIGLLEEALNIGAGNAVTALSQILLCDTDMTLPVVKGVLSPLTTDIFQSIGSNSTCVEMNIVGELQGVLVTIIPETDERYITDLIRQAKEEQRAEGVPDSSIIAETSNILAGAFLTAIHDFCKLNIFHTVPVSENCTSHDFLGRIQQSADDSSNIILVMTNEFVINKSNIKAYLLVILSPDNAKQLIQAIEKIQAV
jgi:chemotaxis protein CheC